MPYSAGMAGYSGEKSSLPSQSGVLEILMVLVIRHQLFQLFCEFRPRDSCRFGDKIDGRNKTLTRQGSVSCCRLT
jgi:hypothetical protein